MPVRTLERLVGVYHADGGLRGDLSYLLGKIRGSAHCALCDITHGYSVTGKRSWKALCRELPISAVHPNERDELLLAFTADRTPCVVAEVAGSYVEVLGPEQLAACSQDVGTFRAALREALDRLDLALPSAA